MSTDFKPLDQMLGDQLNPQPQTSENLLVALCLPHELAIRKQYRDDIKRMTAKSGARLEFEWGVWCDQDQLYFQAEAWVPGLEEAWEESEIAGRWRGLGTSDHNQYTDYLNALFSLEAAIAGFDGSI